jgi:hypothetical protein
MIELAWSTDLWFQWPRVRIPPPTPLILSKISVSTGGALSTSLSISRAPASPVLPPAYISGEKCPESEQKDVVSVNAIFRPQPASA